MCNSANGKTFLPNSGWCFVCGEENPAGLQTRFYVEDDRVKTRFNPREHHCGYKNVVHGGVVAAILDETMGWAAARAIERMCYTAELTVRYVANVPADRETTVVAEVLRANRRLAHVTAELVDDDGTVFARAEGRFTPLSVEETLLVDDMLNYRGDEERVFEKLRATKKG